MRLGTQFSYAGNFAEEVAGVAELERIGVDIVFVPEAYSFDAVSQLGYIAAKTTRLQIASGILQIYTRTPTLTAMTAAGLDLVSDGRFTLGLGASGPQVIEGFHGIPYDAPLGRTREIVEICRQVWRREPVVHDGKHYRIPLPVDEGTGLGKPLRLINHPRRSEIPIMIAALGPQNVALTAEIANAWSPIFFDPEQADEVWGKDLAAGKEKRDAALDELDIVVSVPVAINDDIDKAIEMVRPYYALYIGGMGAPGKNFYYDLACRYGYRDEATEIQRLFLAGEKEKAAAAVPTKLIQATSLIGSRADIRSRLRKFSSAGVTTLLAMPLAADHPGRRDILRELRKLMG